MIVNDPSPRSNYHILRCSSNLSLCELEPGGQTGSVFYAQVTTVSEGESCDAVEEGDDDDDEVEDGDDDDEVGEW